PRAERARPDALLASASDDLLLHIRELPHEPDVVAREAQISGDHVEHDHHPRMANVAEVVYGHAARIHSHLARPERDELLFAARQRVVDLHRRITGYRPPR